MRAAVCLASILALPLAAHSQATGFGVTKCQEFIDAKPQQNEMAKYVYVAWSQGFFAGQNAVHSATDHIQLDTPEPDEIIWFMHEYCLKNRSNMYVQGLIALTLDVARGQAAHGTLKQPR